jgi:SAM-dependent methyltransferase
MHEFVSIDVSHEMVKVAAKCPKIHALVADGEHLPFRPGSFDVIIASRVIKFIDLNSFMKEIKDTLKIGGLVIALFDCGDAFWVKLLEGIGVPVDVGIYNKTLRTQQLLRIMKRHSLNFVKEYPHYSNATIALCPYPSFYDKVCPKA